MGTDLLNDEMEQPGGAESNTPLLARYLNDVCRHALLTRQDEGRLGQQLKDARQALAGQIADLPPRCLDFVLDGAKPGKKLRQEISFAALDERVERLTRYVEANSSAKLRAVVKEVTKHKRLMDQARDAMVQANLRLVIHIVKHYCGNGAPDLDLIQDGSIGLLRAVEKFDHEKGYKFSTYAHWWIRQAVTRALSSRSRTVHIPAHLVQTLRKIQRSFSDLEDKLGREPTREELSEHTQVPLEKLDELIRNYSQPSANAVAPTVTRTAS